MLTGEPVPVSKQAGDKLIGATMNTSGALVMRSERVGAQTVLSQIVQMVAQAQRSKAPMQRMADLVAGKFVLVVVAVAVLTLLVWGWFGPEPSGLALDKPENFESGTGIGVRGRVGARELALGNTTLMRQLSVAV